MFDTSKMTDEELRTAQKEIFAEIEKRAKMEEERLWRNFVDALRAYNKKFGDIEIHDELTVYLNYTNFDLETFGEISLEC
jgi:uncharacterized ferritin-like protein (DUF455 family)